jgi:hypothetical protein
MLCHWFFTDDTVVFKIPVYRLEMQYNSRPVDFLLKNSYEQENSMVRVEQFMTRDAACIDATQAVSVAATSCGFEELEACWPDVLKN